MNPCWLDKVVHVNMQVQARLARWGRAFRTCICTSERASVELAVPVFTMNNLSVDAVLTHMGLRWQLFLCAVHFPWNMVHGSAPVLSIRTTPRMHQPVTTRAKRSKLARGRAQVLVA